MNYLIIHHPGFVAKVAKLGLTLEDVRRIEISIMARPKMAAVMAGTNGLRKVRFAPEGSGAGKSGGVRVCYVLFEERAHLYLITMFAKNEKDNLTKEERNSIAGLIARIGKAYGDAR